MDDSLLGGLFAKQGLQAVPVSPALQAEFARRGARRAEAGAEAGAAGDARAAWPRWLAEYRAHAHGDEQALSDMPAPAPLRRRRRRAPRRVASPRGARPSRSCCASAPSRPTAPPGRASPSRPARRSTRRTHGAGHVEVVLRRHRRRRAADARAHAQGSARRHRLGRHALPEAVAVDARVAHGRPLPDARRVGLRRRPPQADLRRGVPQGGLRQPRRRRHRARPASSRASRSARWRTCAARGCGPGTSTRSSRDVADARRAAWCRCRSSRPIAPTTSERIDGFIAVPTAALAFQWSTEARYVTDLRVVVPARLRARVDARVRSAAARGAHRAVARRARAARRSSRSSGAQQDEELLGGLFAKQGLKTVPASETFRAEFFAQARAAREQIATSGKLVRPDAVAEGADAAGRLSRRAPHPRRRSPTEEPTHAARRTW